jgi:hypothetical protein
VGGKKVEEMTVPELKEELKKRGLKVAGVKAELQVGCFFWVFSHLFL